MILLTVSRIVNSMLPRKEKKKKKKEEIHITQKSFDNCA